MKTPEKIYCSLDIETSGFDPLVNEILEIGFAFFKYEKNKLVVTKEFTKVFKPTKPVAPQILGLTGISQLELEQAPTFAEFKDFIQSEIGEAIIVGHNISFDTKFLEAFGIKFHGQLVDTLDIAQWLLPTHHSYNLENLMHTFGIAHKHAHRALADALATIALLENLLVRFNLLNEKLKKEVLELAEKTTISWSEMLFWEFKSKQKKSSAKEKKVSKLQSEPITLNSNTVYNFPLDHKFFGILQNISNLHSEKTLVVVPKVQNALALYKEGLVDGMLSSEEFRFNKSAFEKFKNKKHLTAEELKFILKVLVWQYTNWQTEIILDLNLSFFGGQFRELITGGNNPEHKKDKVLVCDQATFLKNFNSTEYKNSRLILCGLSEFENAITSNIGVKASWGFITYVIKSFYNSELESGNVAFKKPVEDALLAVDLFFGLVNALLQTDPPSFQYYKITEEILLTENYLKIHGAAESFVKKLEEQNKILKSEVISSFIISVKSFFEKEVNKVKWIELAENRCTLMSMPIQINELVTGYISSIKNVVLIDTLGSDILTNFFVNRLGLTSFKVENVQIQASALAKKKVAQGDLFSGLKQMLGAGNKVNFHFLATNATEADYLQILNKDRTIQTALLLPNPLQVKEFYERNYQILKQKTALLAQSHSGGSNKLLRNFSINPSSLLLVTDKFILKALAGSSQVEQVENLSVKTLVISRLPFEQFSHPYQEAVSSSYSNSFTEFALPKALYNLQSIIKFFYTPKLQDVYIYDAKLVKDYAKVFIEFYKSIPNASKID